ncbi:hypothetical protein RhiirA5_467044 [Rhizophagus irregularis]|uniref:Uncharacterized protein n=1 Tax=Rhizophagus irregularis TaxID=588596 RepID=A0A2I1FDM3_9GLOM|nr:hypothetical protein RhiirA5_467044 [Rhizophagus irregularis]PKY32427.1 hypothetical protein RhiirB3_491829 [Rhizophagus irregularis]CAB5121865.1 unnamed protein product [Rhizophagus irregularis]CAB5372676.1 unnamed protein product [Rhizophagus irregularis]
MCEIYEVYFISEISCVIVFTGPGTHFMFKISSAQEIIDRSIERKYKRPLKNSYMIFMIDCSEAFKITKRGKKKISSLWNSASEKVRDEYTKVFEDYKRLRPNVVAFRHTNEGQEDLSDDTNDSEEEYNRLFDEFVDA